MEHMRHIIVKEGESFVDDETLWYPKSADFDAERGVYHVLIAKRAPEREKKNPYERP